MIRFYQSQYPQENVVIRALYDGCPEEKELTDLDHYAPSEVAVVMGVYKRRVAASFKRGHIIHEQERRGLDNLILETGYIHRGDGPDDYYALGWNGLNGRADFRNQIVPPDRGDVWRNLLKPWHDGEYILLTGQVPWDASCDFIDYEKWIVGQYHFLKQYAGKTVIFREHPKAKGAVKLQSGFPNWPLEKCLEGAHCVVTFNSNTGVDAILAGVPVFAYDRGSMVWEISKHNSQVQDPWKPDRNHWLDRIAYCQWTPKEMAEGLAWAHILKTSKPADASSSKTSTDQK